MTPHLAAALVFVLASAVGAADVAILGRKLLLEELPTGVRVATVMGSERSSPDDVFGDPERDGAVVTVFADGGIPSVGAFRMPSAAAGGDWKVEFGPSGALASVRYRDHAGAHGLVRDLVLVDRPSGNLKVRVTVAGPWDEMPVRPPYPGTSGGMVLTLGNLVCVALGGAAGGEVVNKEWREFRIHRATAEVGCPAPPPTTCGEATYPTCGLACPPEPWPPTYYYGCAPVRMLQSADMSCACIPGVGTCGAPPYYAGPCPSDQVCVMLGTGDGAAAFTGLLGCTAPPLCVDGVFPVCGGNCPGDGVCQAVEVPGYPMVPSCVCVPPASSCSCSGSEYGLGLCPGDEVCSIAWSAPLQCTSAECVAAPQ
jgi:hypothetical protein